jgi:3'-phosphoadenosine 5'-phosphosulfate sulfotransferase (PAPS reductase)/FAD synthetase
LALAKTDILEEHIASIIRAKRMNEIILVFLCNVPQLLVPANIVPSPLILLNILMEAIYSFETYVITIVTLLHIPEDDILHGNRLENLKSYIVLTGRAM